MYKLTQVKQSSESGLLGDFEFVKVYNLQPKNANGIIVQYVNRKTKAIYKGKRYESDKAISDLTDGYVLFSNKSYYEYFEVTNGISVDADSFSSGAIATYTTENGDGFPDIDDDINANGTITYDAYSYFISNKNPLYDEIINLKWDDNVNLPANGLPYLSCKCKKKLEKFEENADSNIVYHKVIVTWMGNQNDSVIHSSFSSS